jgi:Do/DeqQ family serine protease
MKSYRNWIAAAAVTGLIGTGAVMHAQLEVTPAYAQRAPAGLTDASIPDVAERVVDSVVNISTAKAVRGFGVADADPFFTDPDSPGYGREPNAKQQASKGSGVVISSQGRILTNSHVVNGADDITVTLQDGTEHQATIIGQDPRADLAVLQLKGKVSGLKPLVFGDSNSLRLGEVVLAVGDPFGVGKSVTMGIVSAKGRSGMGIEDYEDFIQTDAAINPGNSGGALVNLKGELVGINTAIASKSGGYAGIGFAIPSNMAKPIMDMLVKDGKVVRGYLGVNIQTVTAQLARDNKLPAARGVYIGGVDPNGPAAKAGLSEGDIVTGFNGVEVKNGDVLRNTIAMMRPGTTVDLEVVRNNVGKRVIKAKLADLEEALKSQQRTSPRRRR